MKILFLIILTVAGILFGCKNSTDTENSNTYFAVGDTMFYAIQSFDPNGKQLSSSTDTISIVSSHVIDGKKQLVLSNGSIMLLDSLGNGKLSSFTESDLQTTYPLPSRMGDTLMKIDSIPTKINGIVTIMNIRLIAGNIDTILTVPAGIFHTQVFNYLGINAADKTLLINGKIFISQTEGVIERETFATSPSTKKEYLEYVTVLKQKK